MGRVVLARDERGSGPALVLVHGFPLDRAMWGGTLDGTAGLRRCIAVDLRAHGDSPGPPVDGVDEHADDLAATLDALDTADADLCGWSMGGYVALALLRRHPARVRSLVLCSTKVDADAGADRAARDAAVERVRAHGTAILHDELWPLMAASPTPAGEALFRSSVGRLTPEAAVADLLAMRDRPDASADLAGSRVPVLWIAGERDRIVPPAAARAAAARAGTRFEVVRGAGHLVPIEKARRFTDVLSGFLGGKRGGRWFARARPG